MLLGFMSLVPTPLLVFVTSSTKLYAPQNGIMPSCTINPKSSYPSSISS